MKTIIKLLVSLVATFAFAFIGSSVTTPSIPTWYAGLAKPELAPPNWVFAPVWTTLYILMALAAFLVWRRGLSKKEVKLALGVYVGQLVLNALWSILFFGFRSPGAALIGIILLLASIIATMVVFAKVSKKAPLLLIPYLAWVSFATYLNFSIWILNK